jgi:hypothetical protein
MLYNGEITINSDSWGVLMGELDVIGLIKKRFAETGNDAQIPMA